MNLGGHRRGEVKGYDEGDPVLARRVAAGWLVPVGVPAGAKPVEAEAPKKRAPRKKKANPNPEVEVEGLAEVVEDVPADEPEAEPVVEESSVQTSWYISPSQSEG